MTNINNLTYEVWYQFKKDFSPRRLAAFHFRFEAEKYIEIFHPKNSQHYFIVDCTTKEIESAV